MITKIDHIGIAVNCIDEIVELLSKIPGITVTHRETFPSAKVKAAMIPIGDGKIELLEATGPESLIAEHVSERGEGVHHVALGVTDIEAMLESLRENGVPLIDSVPRMGIGGNKVAFLDPKGTKVLLELVEPVAIEQ